MYIHECSVYLLSLVYRMWLLFLTESPVKRKKTSSYSEERTTGVDVSAAGTNPPPKKRKIGRNDGSGEVRQPPPIPHKNPQNWQKQQKRQTTALER